MLRTLAGLTCLVLLTTCGLNAANGQECQARVILPVQDDLGKIWRSGSILPSISSEPR